MVRDKIYAETYRIIRYKLEELKKEDEIRLNMLKFGKVEYPTIKRNETKKSENAKEEELKDPKKIVSGLMARLLQAQRNHFISDDSWYVVMKCTSE